MGPRPAIIVKPARGRSLRHDVAEALRTDVLGGRLAPGERILEVDLAHRFGVSRQPVREAIRWLEREGLVTSFRIAGRLLRVSRLRMRWRSSTSASSSRAGSRAWSCTISRLPIPVDDAIDVTYVKDLALGIRLALTVRPLNHRIFNITGGISRRRSEVADLARQLVPGARITLGSGYPASAHLRGPSVLRLAGEELGYAPRYTLETGMADWLVYLQRSAASKEA